MKKWIAILGVCSLSVACGQPSSTEEAAEGSAEAGGATAGEASGSALREVTIPAGTNLRLDLRTALASDTSRVEDPVSATLREALVIDGREVLPAGTTLTGNVTQVERSGRVQGRARLAYRFVEMEQGDQRYDITTATIAHEAEATKGEDATKIAVGAAAGAAVGALLGGGDGAAKGAAIGGAGGTGVVLATRGEEVRLGAGANVTARLTEPLQVRVR